MVGIVGVKTGVVVGEGVEVCVAVPVARGLLVGTGVLGGAGVPEGDQPANRAISHHNALAALCMPVSFKWMPSCE